MQKFLVERAKAEMDGTPAKCTNILGTFEVQPTAEDDEYTKAVNEGRPVHPTKVKSTLSLEPGLKIETAEAAKEESATPATIIGSAAVVSAEGLPESKKAKLVNAQEEDASDKFERAKAKTTDAQPVRPEKSAIERKA